MREARAWGGVTSRSDVRNRDTPSWTFSSTPGSPRVAYVVGIFLQARSTGLTVPLVR